MEVNLISEIDDETPPTDSFDNNTNIYSKIVRLPKIKFYPSSADMKQMQDARAAQAFWEKVNSWEYETYFLHILIRPSLNENQAHVQITDFHVFHSLVKIFKNIKLRATACLDTPEKEKRRGEMSVKQKQGHLQGAWTPGSSLVCEDLQAQMSPQFFQVLNNEHVKVKLTVSLVVPPIPSIRENRVGKGMARILREKIDAEFTLILNDVEGVKVKRHRVFLPANSDSPVFTTMLSTPMTEARTGVIQMEMTKQSLKAFISYLHTTELILPIREPQVAIELLEVGHKYDIKEMEAIMKTILQETPLQLFTVEESIRLFTFVRNVEALTTLKGKAVQVFALNKEKLKNSQEFQKLLQHDSPSSVEIVWDIVESMAGMILKMSPSPFLWGQTSAEEFDEDEV